VSRGALIAAAIGFALLWAPPASAEVVFGTDGCFTSQREPEVIALACADGKIKFEARERRLWLGTRKAAQYMRRSLARRPTLSFADAYARKVSCEKRLSGIRLRCRMSWIYGDTYFEGRGAVWLRPRGNGVGLSYRVRKRNAYCEATEGSNCVEAIAAPDFRGHATARVDSGALGGHKVDTPYPASVRSIRAVPPR
jgi:hypothetical protein